MKIRSDLRITGGNEDDLYLSNVLALHFWSLDLPFIPEDGKERVGKDHRQAQAPDKSDGIEEIGVA